MRQSWAQAFCTFVFLHFNRDAEPKAWPPTGSCDSDLKQICRLNLTLKVLGGKHKVLEVSKSKTAIPWRKSIQKNYNESDCTVFHCDVTIGHHIKRVRANAFASTNYLSLSFRSARIPVVCTFCFTYRSFGELFLTCI